MTRTEQKRMYKDFHLLNLVHLLYRCLVFIVSGEQKWSEAEEIVLHDLSNEEK